MTLIEEVYLPLLLAATVIIIGSLGSYLFRKTGIPDMLFLVLLGVVFGPILGFIELEAIAPLAPYLAVLALIIILLDGGMNLKLQRLVSESPRAVALAIISFLLSVILIAVIKEEFKVLTILKFFIELLSAFIVIKLFWPYLVILCMMIVLSLLSPIRFNDLFNNSDSLYIPL